jgi:hypothetical protein
MKLSLSALAFLLISASASARMGSLSHRKLLDAPEDAVVVPNQYIVVFKDSVEDAKGKVNALLKQNRGKGNASIKYEYESAIKGMALTKVPPGLLKQLLDAPEVEYVEEVSGSYRYGWVSRVRLSYEDLGI